MKEEKSLVLKNYEIDYSFIIKNYLEPKMWQKKWNLLIYKNFVFTLRMSSIYVQEEKIYFYIKLEDIKNTTDYRDDWNHCYEENSYEESINFSLKIDDVSFLEKKINSAMLDCIERLERKKIMGTERYQEIRNGKGKEIRTLTEIAEEFLDDNNVKNEDIREAYIDVFVENNKKIDKKLSEYQQLRKYNELTELYLVFANINENKNLLDKIERNSLDIEYLREIEKEVLEYIENLETEEFKEEMQGNLEDI